ARHRRIACDLPVDVDRALHDAASRWIVWIGDQPRPQHDAVRPRIAGCDPQCEGVCAGCHRRPARNVSDGPTTETETHRQRTDSTAEGEELAPVDVDDRIGSNTD